MGFFSLAIFGFPSANILLGDIEVALGHVPESRLLEVSDVILCRRLSESEEKFKGKNTSSKQSAESYSPAVASS